MNGLVFRQILIKSRKHRRCPFPKRPCIGTYPSHRGLCPGCLLRKPPDWDRSTRRRWTMTCRSWFSERFGAGWSSPVARQAHNLKVIGSNPIPATKHLTEFDLERNSRPPGRLFRFSQLRPSPRLKKFLNRRGGNSGESLLEADPYPAIARSLATKRSSSSLCCFLDCRVASLRIRTRWLERPSSCSRASSR